MFEPWKLACDCEKLKSLLKFLTQCISKLRVFICGKAGSHLGMWVRTLPPTLIFWQIRRLTASLTIDCGLKLYLEGLC